MRFFSLFAATASLIGSFVSAQNNPLAITAPLDGSYAAGSEMYITWTPTEASTVTLQLRYGSFAGNLATGDPIACKFFIIYVSIRKLANRYLQPTYQIAAAIHGLYLHLLPASTMPFR